MSPNRETSALAISGSAGDNSETYYNERDAWITPHDADPINYSSLNAKFNCQQPSREASPIEEDEDPTRQPSDSEFGKRLRDLCGSGSEELHKQAIERWDADPSIHGSSSSGLQCWGSLDRVDVPTASPTAVYDAVVHQGRRDNPKVSRVRFNRLVSLDGPSCRPTCELQSGYATTTHEPCRKTEDGMFLFHLSETVPHLLGPQEYITGLGALATFHTPPMISMDEDGKELFKQLLTGSLDRALLLILMFAEQHEAERSIIVQHWLSPFVFDAYGLRYWKDTGFGPPREARIVFEDFRLMLKVWQNSLSLIRPGEPTSTLARWAQILEMLDARSIPIESIDQRLFFDLISLKTRELLDRRIGEFQDVLHVSNLQDRSMRRSKPFPEAFDYVDTSVSDPHKLYSFRFSHKAPTGHLQDPSDEKSHDTFYDSGSNHLHPKPSITRKLKEGKTKFTQSRYSSTCKWLAVILVFLGLVAIVLSVLYPRLGVKKQIDW
jgi:hypothetical protein